LNKVVNAAEYADNILQNGYSSLSSQVDSILDLMKRIWGEEYIENAIDSEKLYDDIYSDNVEDRIYALQKLILKEDTYVDDPLFIMEKIHNEIALIIARRHVESKIESEVEKLLEEKQDKLIDEIRMNIIKKQKGPENSRTLKKLADLQKMDGIKLSKSIMELLRPSDLSEIIGQERAVSSILTKIASPYPQHEGLPKLVEIF
jgi:ATP-dependent Lon protease